MKLTTSIIYFAAAFALFLSGDAAIAQDVKTHTGSMCQPAAGSTAASLFASTSFARNNGAAALRVVCPIVRDNHFNANGTLSAHVRVHSPSGAPIYCALASHDANSNTVASTTDISAGNFIQWLFVDVNASANNGHYAIRCTLPPNGRVLFYRIGEFAPTD